MASKIQTYYINPGLTTRDGSFNQEFCPHLQIYGKPEQDRAIVPVHQSHLPKFIAKAFQSKAVARSAFQRAVKNSPSLWTPREMRGAEYERAGSNDYVSRVAVKNDMIAFSMDLDFTMEQAPPLSMQRDLREDLKQKTIQQTFADDGVTLPETIKATVHIITPKGKVAAVKEMLQNYAARETEAETHRGLGINKQVAFQSLSAEQQTALSETRVKRSGEYAAFREDVAWFEIFQGIFFTIDETMFENAKIAFGARTLKTQAPQGPMPKVA